MSIRLLTLVFCLPLGAATTVAAAWLSATRISHDFPAGGPPYGYRYAASSDSPSTSWAVDRYWDASAAWICSVWYDAGCDVGPAEALRHISPTEIVSPEELVPDWASALIPTGQSASPALHTRTIEMHGWPLCSMWSLHCKDLHLKRPRPAGRLPTFEREIRNGIELTGWRRSGPSFLHRHSSRVLPLGIRWPGFTVDALFYAAAWAVLGCAVTSPIRLRRWLRLRRSQCPRCGYPVGVSEVCTECGAAVPGATTRSAANGGAG